MTPERFKYFSKKNIIELRNLKTKDFTLSELKEIINEAILNDEDRKIAELKYLKNLNANEIADIVFRDVRTIRSHLIKIDKVIHNTIIAIFLIDEAN